MTSEQITEVLRLADKRVAARSHLGADMARDELVAYLEDLPNEAAERQERYLGVVHLEKPRLTASGRDSGTAEEAMELYFTTHDERLLSAMKKLLAAHATGHGMTDAKLSAALYGVGLTQPERDAIFKELKAASERQDWNFTINVNLAPGDGDFVSAAQALKEELDKWLASNISVRAMMNVNDCD